jgi:hypothetical protein
VLEDRLTSRRAFAVHGDKIARPFVLSMGVFST